MVNTTRIGKTLRIDRMRAILGDEETEKILTVMGASKVLPGKIPTATPEQIAIGADILTGDAAGRNLLPKAAVGWRRFFATNPRASKKYLVWAKGELAAQEPDPEAEPVAQKRTRRKRTAVA